jgi:hypothetical protein
MEQHRFPVRDNTAREFALGRRVGSILRIGQHMTGDPHSQDLGILEWSAHAESGADARAYAIRIEGERI